MKEQYGKRVKRDQLACTNLAHAAAAEDNKVKIRLKNIESPNIGIVTAYNDMLSAHQPYYRYPEVLKDTIIGQNATARLLVEFRRCAMELHKGRLGWSYLYCREILLR